MGLKLTLPGGLVQVPKKATDQYLDGEVATYNDLPVSVNAPSVNSAYLVRQGSGVYLLSRKPAGIYIRNTANGNLADWAYAGTFPDVFSDANFTLYNNSDSSKNIKFDLAGVSAGATRTLAVPNTSGTLALTDAAQTFTQNLTLNGTNNTAPNQTAASGSSLLTRDLADARYSPVSTAIAVSDQSVTNSTAFVGATNGCVLTLAAGTYYLNISLLYTNDSAAGVKSQVSLSVALNAGSFVQELFGIANATPTANWSSGVITGIGFRQLVAGGGAAFFHRADGIIDVAAAVTLTAQFCNHTASGVSTLKKGSFIIARKIN